MRGSPQGPIPILLKQADLDTSRDRPGVRIQLYTDLQQNLKTTQEQMISLQQQYAQMVEEKDASFESNRNLQDQLSAAQHQTARLRRQQEMLHGKLRSLARLESAQAQAVTQQERSISPKRSSPTLKAHNLEH